MNTRLTFPRTEREAFQGLANPRLTPRESRFVGPFREPLIERLMRFLRGLFA